MTSQQQPNQKTQDNRYANQGAVPQEHAGKNLSQGAAESPSHATEGDATRDIRRTERATPAK